jgi:hypothetical protein
MLGTCGIVVVVVDVVVDVVVVVGASVVVVVASVVVVVASVVVVVASVVVVLEPGSTVVVVVVGPTGAGAQALTPRPRAVASPMDTTAAVCRNCRVFIEVLRGGLGCTFCGAHCCCTQGERQRGSDEGNRK